MGPVPLWAEVAFAAVEDFTHGTAVVDGVMLGIGLHGPGRGAHPLDARGRPLRRASRAATRPSACGQAIDGVENADVVGEFAFGVSDKAPYGTPSEKGRAGTVHLALGDNHNAYPGGQNVLLAAPGRRVPRSHHADRRRRHATSSGTASGCCDRGRRRRARRRASPSSCRGGSWSRMLVTDARVSGNASSLGYSVFRPGPPPRRCAHETEEVAYVVTGTGELRLDDEAVPFARGRRRSSSRPASGTRWPTPETSDVVMVFGFPSPGYPADRAACRRPMVATARSLREQVALGLPHPGARGLRRPHPRPRQRPGAGRARRHIKRKGVALDEVEPADVVELDLEHDGGRSRPTCTSRRSSTARSTGGAPTSARSCTATRRTPPPSAPPTPRSSC